MSNNCRSLNRPATSCKPTGIPIGPSNSGSVTAGVPSAVQVELKMLLPVDPNPSGGSPGCVAVWRVDFRSEVRRNPELAVKMLSVLFRRLSETAQPHQ